MHILRLFVRFAAAPTFFLLAWFNLASAGSLQDHMAMMGMEAAQDTGAHLGVLLPPAVANALGSMWLMYALMGVFHSGAWLQLVGSHRPAGGARR